MSSIAESVAEDEEFSVIMLDLDGFKDVNDTYGHAFGDRVLQHVAGQLRTLTRSTDTLARTGGDEFVFLCPNTDRRASEEIVGRALAAVSGLDHLDGKALRLGASVGIKHQRGPGANPEVLLQHADAAMYAAKRAGRGRVHLA